MSTTPATGRVNAGLLAASPRWLYLALFTLSGFSGLIYESIWSHYLKLFLGHAAYAQSLVLMIFMGGMAAGAAAASRWSGEIARPLVVYALVEGAIGVFALLFHREFLWVTGTIYESVLPGIGVPTLAASIKWTVAALLILPPSVLLGMTFPLMSGGIIRRYPAAPGETIAMLYFTNSMGAAVGVLVSGFWLIRVAGLPGTILTAGVLNIGLALAVWVLAKLDPVPVLAPAAREAVRPAAAVPLASLLIAAAFLTGAASFMYEMAWIRMLSLVLGGTTHSFELMLSAFITGLAAGGFWIRRRVDVSRAPLRLAGSVQVLMGVFAALTIPVYVRSFGWMADIMAAASRTDAGFTFFTVASHGIALAIMIPATFFAGMTLPLFTRELMKSGRGEAAIGSIYAANTVGGIVGVVFALHVGLPLLGLKDLVLLAAALDIGLGLVLIGRAPDRRVRHVFAGGVLALCAIALVVSTTLDPLRLAAGVYRTGKATLSEGTRVLFYRDGKTASVSLTAFPDGSLSLATNGKPDASIQMRPGAVSIDEITMLMLGAVPLAYKPDARRIGNVGFGSGMTTHTLLGSSRVETVDTVEIEPAMVAAARGYGERAARAFSDPRSHIHFDDAKSFFSTRNERYDIIVTEPSNPWVSGVASLFSREFYASMGRHLTDDGLFVQWLQLYEFNDQLVLSVLGALSHEFSDYVVYNTDDQDVLIIARKKGRLGEPDFHGILTGTPGSDLARAGIRDATDLLARRTADKRLIDAVLASHPVPANSDFFPFVDLNAGPARFRGESAGLMRMWSVAPLPVLEMLTGTVVDPARISPDESFFRLRRTAAAMNIYDQRVARVTPRFDAGASASLYSAVTSLGLIAEGCSIAAHESVWLMSMTELAEGVLPYLDPPRAEALLNWAARPACAAGVSPLAAKTTRLYLAVARRDPAAMQSAATDLLEMNGATDQRLRGYAVGAAMLAALSHNEPGEALAYWRRYGSAIYLDQPVPAWLDLLLSLSMPAAAHGQERAGIAQNRQ